MSKEAMQLALEALESDPISHAGLVSRKQAITALRQALEEKPPKREWVGLTDEEISAVDWKQNETLHDYAKHIELKLRGKNT